MRKGTQPPRIWAESAEAEASLNNAAKFVDPILAKDPQNQRALFIATTIAHDRMNLADTRGARAEELKDAADTASLVERFMSTHPVAIHDLYSMRYFYVNVAEAYYAGREFDKVILYSQRALDIPVPGSRANDLRGAILGNLAAARWQSGDLDDALKTAHECHRVQGGRSSRRARIASCINWRMDTASKV